MKKYILSTSILGLFAISAFAQEATYTDIYFNQPLSTDYSPWSDAYYFQNTSSWNVGSLEGEVLNVSPNNSSYNLFIVGTAQRSGGTFLLPGYNIKNWDIHDITFNLTSQTFFSFTTPSDKNFNVGGDFTAEVATNNWGSGSFRLALEGSATASIAGNLYIKNTTSFPEGNTKTHNNGVEFFVEHSGTGLYTSSFILDGDVIMSDNGLFTYEKGWSRENYFNSRIKLAFSVSYSEIKGTVNLAETTEGDRVIDLFRNNISDTDAKFSEATRLFGGINGTGSILIGATVAKTVDLVFTNSKSQSFKGALAGGNTSSVLNITMDASSPKAKQAMHIVEDHAAKQKDGENTAFYDNIAISSVSVINGTFELGTYADMKNGSLYISGKDAKFVVGGAEVETLGSVNFTSAAISAGSLGIAFNQNVYGSLTISAGDSTEEGAGSFYVADPSSFTITLDYIPVEDSILTEQLADFGGEMDLGTIISFEETNLTAENITNDIIVKIVDQNGNAISGVEAMLSAIIDNDKVIGIGAIISSAAVPEPATVAGIFGLFALAFVAYRRRK